jgi:flagellar biosynthesis protein FlhB
MSVPDRDRRVLPPTAKRVREFRRRGEVALSRDLTAVATLLGGAIGGVMFARSSLGALAGFMRTELAGGTNALPGSLGAATHTIFAAAAPVGFGALAGYFVAAALQLGFPPALRFPKPDLGRLFSGQSLSKLFSPRAAGGRALKASAKVAVVGIACATVVLAELRGLAAGAPAGAVPVAVRLGHALLHLSLVSIATLGALAAFDYFWARRELNARMRMTLEEFKREHKENEGDPHVRRRRRQVMRQLAKRRIEKEVKAADVVLVNPTEYAVALRYRSDKDRAPRVVAKGRGTVAERIREIARRAGVPIVPNPPLARLIHKVVREGREIPGSLYAAVAEILAYVYRLKRGRR